MILAEAREISGKAALRDDSIRPPKLQFGNPDHIQARDLLALAEEVEDLFKEVGNPRFPVDPVHAGSTRTSLIETREALRAVRDGWGF